MGRERTAFVALLMGSCGPDRLVGHLIRGGVVVTAMFVVVGAGTAPAFAGTGEQSQSRQAPKGKPVAQPGEPVIRKEQDRYRGRPTVFSQNWRDAGTFSVTEPSGSISTLYYAFGSRTEAIPAQKVPVTCSISDNGTVRLRSCTARGEVDKDGLLAFSIVRYRSKGIDFPKVSEVDKSKAQVIRLMDMELDIPQLVPPQVDLTSGPLVKANMLNMRLRNVSRNYPSRALRSEAEGAMQIECQVQQDLSVICTPLSFDPPEHFDLFKRVARTMFRAARPEPFLKDGTSARGVRYQSKIVFKLPD